MVSHSDGSSLEHDAHELGFVSKCRIPHPRPLPVRTAFDIRDQRSRSCEGGLLSSFSRSIDRLEHPFVSSF